MSTNPNDQPAAGHMPAAPYERGGDRQKPDPGHVFVRTAGGSVQLAQTNSLFWKRGSR